MFITIILLQLFWYVLEANTNKNLIVACPDDWTCPILLYNRKNQND